MATKRLQCLLMGCVCGAVLICRLAFTFSSNWIITGLLFVVTGIFLDMYQLKPTSSHTYRTLILHYLLLRVSWVLGKIGESRFMNACFDISKAQKRTLLKILKNNSKSVFAKDYKLDTVTTVSEFRNTMPMLTYQDHLPYIKRAMEGESNVFFPQSIDFITATSGTTSKKSKEFLKSRGIAGKFFLDTLAYFGYIYMKNRRYLRRIAWSGCVSEATLSPNGIKRGSFATMVGLTQFPHISRPNITIKIKNAEQTAYIDLLFSLRDKDILCIQTFVAPNLLSMFKAMETHWKTLCDDIEKGTLFSGLAIDGKIRSELEAECYPDAERAVSLRQEFEKGFNGIASRIWPRCNIALAVSSGTFQHYADIVRNKYLGTVRLHSHGHVSSEGVLGVNLWPEWNQSVYAPNLLGMFYEWLPVDDGDAEPVLLHEVETGREYEMLITSPEGLYRYRTEDIVRFTGRYFHLPVYEFVRRKGDMLGIGALKLPVSFTSQILLDIFADKTFNEVVDYAFAESVYYEKARGDVSGDAYGVLLLETKRPIADLEEITHTFDNKLCDMLEEYSRWRKNETLKTFKVHQLKPGSFARFKAFRLSSNKMATSVQYKVLRIIRNEEFLRVLMDNSPAE